MTADDGRCVVICPKTQPPIDAQPLDITCVVPCGQGHTRSKGEHAHGGMGGMGRDRVGVADAAPGLGTLGSERVAAVAGVVDE